MLSDVIDTANGPTIGGLASTVAVLCGVVVPFIVDIVTKSSAPRWLKSGLATVLAALAGALTTVTWGDSSNWHSYVLNVFIAFATALTVHRTGVTDPVQRATATMGVTARTSNPVVVPAHRSEA